MVSLRRRIETLERLRRVKEPDKGSPQPFDPALVTDELLDRVEPIFRLMETKGEGALTPEHHATLEDYGAFYGALKARGIDIYVRRRSPEEAAARAQAVKQALLEIEHKGATKCEKT